MMSVALPAVLKVRLLPANFIVLVSKRLPVASCVSMNVALLPLAMLATELKVMLPVKVIFCMLPSVIFGVMVPVALPKV
jgi:hypothetical protein